MKFKSLFKKSNILTCEYGWFQGSYQGQVFLEFVPRFEDYSFACNAPKFFEALSILEEDYFINVDNEKIVLADTKQEIILAQQNGEILLQPPESFERINIAKILNDLYQYVSLDYPFIRFFNASYAEIITPTRIIRKNLQVKLGDFCVYAYKVPANAIGFANKQGQLWIQYEPRAFIGIAHYIDPIPNTNKFFEKEIAFKEMPTNFIDNLINTEKTSFVDGKVIQFIEDIVGNSIENIEGSGTYYTEDLLKGLKHCTHWAFVDGLLYARGQNITVVIGEADA